jgi:hypothetical protein
LFIAGVEQRAGAGGGVEQEEQEGSRHSVTRLAVSKQHESTRASAATTLVTMVFFTSQLAMVVKNLKGGG